MTAFADFRCHEDVIIPIYLRCGAKPFTHRQIADIITAGAVTGFSRSKYFLAVKDAAGRRLRSETHAFIWQLNPVVVKRCEKVIVEQNDHRWENLAAGLTGEGSA